jgi:hypothetical protein
MTAAAYPLSIANGISRCLHNVEIAPVVQATKCTAFDWRSLNYTSLAMSCGPQRIRADRCCNYILGMMGQGHTIYRNRTGHELPQVGATPLLPVDFRGLRILELVGTADVRRLPPMSKDVRMSDREMEIQAWGVSLYLL